MSARRVRVVTLRADLKRERLDAAEKSLEFISDRMTLGLGTGSTASHVVRLLGERVKHGLNISGVPTSERTRQLAITFGVPIVTFDDHPTIDLTIDGADEFDTALNLIKGGGGTLFHEKIVASASKHFIIVVESTKRVSRLGAFPLPVEVVPLARKPISLHLREMGAQPKLRLGSANEPFVTDEGNYILDCTFRRIDEPLALSRSLSSVPGIVEHGLFVGMADLVIMGAGGGTQLFRR